jgi:hypothetical protein
MRLFEFLGVRPTQDLTKVQVEAVFKLAATNFKSHRKQLSNYNEVETVLRLAGYEKILREPLEPVKQPKPFARCVLDPEGPTPVVLMSEGRSGLTGIGQSVGTMTGSRPIYRSCQRADLAERGIGQSMGTLTGSRPIYREQPFSRIIRMERG